MAVIELFSHDDVFHARFLLTYIFLESFCSFFTCLFLATVLLDPFPLTFVCLSILFFAPLFLTALSPTAHSLFPSSLFQ